MSKIIEGQDKELFLQFIDFCDKQPKDKKIDHDSWSTCAIGEFHDYIGADCHIVDFPYKVLGLGDDETDLVVLVGDGRCPEFYGEFTEFLREWL